MPMHTYLAAYTAVFGIGDHELAGVKIVKCNFWLLVANMKFQLSLQVKRTNCEATKPA